MVMNFADCIYTELAKIPKSQIKFGPKALLQSPSQKNEDYSPLQPTFVMKI